MCYYYRACDMKEAVFTVKNISVGGFESTKIGLQDILRSVKELVLRCGSAAELSGFGENKVYGLIVESPDWGIDGETAKKIVKRMVEGALKITEKELLNMNQKVVLRKMIDMLVNDYVGNHERFINIASGNKSLEELKKEEEEIISKKSSSEKDLSPKYNNSGTILLEFTSDLNVAKRFAGNSGYIIRVKVPADNEGYAGSSLEKGQLFFIGSKLEEAMIFHRPGQVLSSDTRKTPYSVNTSRWQQPTEIVFLEQEQGADPVKQEQGVDVVTNIDHTNNEEDETSFDFR